MKPASSSETILASKSLHRQSKELKKRFEELCAVYRKQISWYQRLRSVYDVLSQ